MSRFPDRFEKRFVLREKAETEIFKEKKTGLISRPEDDN